MAKQAWAVGAWAAGALAVDSWEIGADITSTSAPNGQQNAAYNFVISRTGNAASMTWSVTVGALPTGLTLGASTGIISGVPTLVETQAFTVQLVNPVDTDTQALSIQIVAAGAGGAGGYTALGFGLGIR